MDQTQPVSTGSLKISLKLPNPARRTCPFYLMKESLPPPHPLLGSRNLINAADLGAAHQKFCTSGKLKTDLASFLPQLCNTKDLCSTISSSTNLRTLIEKPPITGKAIMPPNDLKGFTLVPGTVPEAYRLFDTGDVSRLLGNVPTMAPIEDDSKNYDEFGNNYGDSVEEKKAHRMKLKRTLDDNESEVGEKKSKKHKKDKKKSKKDKKKDKERKDVDTDDNSRPSFSSFH
uniref:Mediator of RNA polymerase II transcription subunit 19 n=1 Tax=Panagrolaimus superbus TaxID=310955 RepID=A0A914Y2E7_9BILA